MSTQRKRTLAAALTLALAAGLTACETGDDAGTGDAPESPTEVGTTTEETTPATTDDADDTDDGTGTGTAGGTDDGTGTAGGTDDGTGTAGGTDDGTGTAGDTDDSTGTDAAGDLTAVALEAVATAQGEAGGAAYEIDDKDDDGTWEVDVAVGERSVEVTVSEDGLTVVETDDDDELDDDTRAGLDAATVNLQDAIGTAVAEVGGVFDDAALEEEDGAHVWEVSVDGTDAGDDDVEVYVDVTTGEVVKTDA